MTHSPSTIEQLYHTELQPVLQALQEKRANVRSRALISGAVIAAVATVAALLLAQAVNGILAIFVVVIGVLIWFGVNHGGMNRYRDMFKGEVMQRIVEVTNPDMQYYPESGITEGEFRSSRIFDRGIDRYNCEDLLEGRVGATAFRMSEVHAEYKTTSTDSKGNTQTHWHTIFKGIFFIADFNKDFMGTTLVVPDFAQRTFGQIGQMFQGLAGRFSGLELVKLEDPEFERMFAVYTTDQIKARYILSTSLMQRLVAFRQRMEQDISLSFVDSHLFIAISSNKNHFEPPSLWFGSGMVSMDDIREYIEDLQLAEDIVEDLNLNTRIWSKQG